MLSIIDIIVRDRVFKLNDFSACMRSFCKRNISIIMFNVCHLSNLLPDIASHYRHISIPTSLYNPVYVTNMCFINSRILQKIYFLMIYNFVLLNYGLLNREKLDLIHKLHVLFYLFLKRRIKQIYHHKWTYMDRPI